MIATGAPPRSMCRAMITSRPVLGRVADAARPRARQRREHSARPRARADRHRRRQLRQGPAAPPAIRCPRHLGARRRCLPIHRPQALAQGGQPVAPRGGPASMLIRNHHGVRDWEHFLGRRAGQGILVLASRGSNGEPRPSSKPEPRHFGVEKIHDQASRGLQLCQEPFRLQNLQQLERVRRRRSGAQRLRAACPAPKTTRSRCGEDEVGV
jgi:hypothetical protein